MLDEITIESSTVYGIIISAVFILFNIGVILGINVLYIFAKFNSTRDELFWIQVSLTVIKLFWMSFAVPSVVRSISNQISLNPIREMSLQVHSLCI